MSTIFDALKRSDRERQMNTTHTMSYSHLHAEESSSKAGLKYLLLVLGLFAIIAAVLYFSFKPQAVSVSNNAITQPEEITPASQADIKTDVKSEISSIIQADIIQSDIEAAALSEKVETLVNEMKQTEEKPELVVPSDSPRQSLADVAKNPIPPANIVLPKIDSRPNAANAKRDSIPNEVDTDTLSNNDFIGYKNYSAIRSSKNLPDLHLDILMYHPNASQRKAFINLTAYKQGEKTSDGVEVRKISEKGVLLNYQGIDFVLSAN